MSKFGAWIASALIGSAMAAAGCSAWSGGGPAVAAVSMRLSRNPVPIGGPVDVTLQFDLPPDLLAFAENDRVLLRFLFDDGEVMASYDHNPPVSTRDWHPGATVKYTQRIFVPDLPYVGNVPVLVGLYSPTSGRRLRLAGKDHGDRTYKVGALTLQAPRSLLVFTDGWNREEHSTELPAGWRWTEGEASMTVQNPRQDAVLYLRLEGRPRMFDAPQQVSVVARDRTIQRFSVTSETPVDYELPLSADDLGPADEVQLTLKVDKTFVPAQLRGESTDTRVLGVRVFNAFLEPRAHD